MPSEASPEAIPTAGQATAAIAVWAVVSLRRTLAGGTAGHQGDRGPGDERPRVLDKPLVVAGMPTGVHDPGQRAFDDPAAGSRTNPEVSFGRLTVLIVRFRWRLAQVAWQGRTGSLSHVCRSASGLVGHEADVSASLMPLSVENAKRTVSTNLHLPGAGPHPHVSEPVLATAARALGLADTERDYLFALAGLALSACSVAARPARSAPVPVHRIPQPPPDRWLLHHYGSPDTLITRARRRGRRRAP